MASQLKSLFRYRSLSAYSLGELVNDTMWFSKPSAFNDPFDCSLTIDPNTFGDSLEHAIGVGKQRGLISPDLPHLSHKPTDLDKGMFQKMRDQLRGAAADIGLCCLTANPRSILMWSHYANHHRGFCVEYSLAKGTLLEQEAVVVNYRQKMPNLTLSDISPANAHQTVETLWRTKSACWKYEKEWRVLAPEGNKNYPARSPVLAVIFGQRMPISDRKIVEDALRSKPQIKLKEAILDESRFAIQLRPSGRV